MSSVYIEAGMQGILEKKGVLRNTKYNATVQGSTLYLERGGVVNMVNLGEAHQVRKVTNDPSHSQFEICLQQKKKSISFSCPNNKECDAWVTTLREALVLKDSVPTYMEPRRGSTSTFYTLPAEDEDEEIYTTIQENEGGASKIEVFDDNVYAEPDDTQTKVSEEPQQEGIYQDVVSATEELSENKGSENQTEKERSSSLDVVDTPGESYIQMRRPSQDSRLSALSSRSGLFVAQASTPHVPVVANTSEYNGDQDVEYTDAQSATLEEVMSNKEGTVTESTDKKSSITTDLSGLKNESKPVSSSENGKHDMDDDVVDLFQVLAEALSTPEEDVKELSHPLSDEDYLPLQDVIQFISCHHSVCRNSRSLLSSDGVDPVDSLSQYLQSINTNS